MRIVTVFGTRPEAIKMAPVIKALDATSGVESIVCSTGQHRDMLRSILSLFDITPDHDLDVMVSGQSLNALFARTLSRVSDLLDELKPDRILVHGDTTTAGAAALAAFHQNIPVGHVEAGLRTRNMREPWPEEMNRRLVDLVSDQFFAPTESARKNLIAEHVERADIHVTGNTVIDALLQTRDRLRDDRQLNQNVAGKFPELDDTKKLVVVTGHRRENFGPAFRNITSALRDIAADPCVQIIYPVHLNPNVQKPVYEALSGLHNVFLLPPLDYLSFVYLMDRATILISDSGGVQEEAPSLGKLVLVTRNVTERPEAVDAGTVELVGTDHARIVERCFHYLNKPELLAKIAKVKNPYGDGRAAERILKEILR